MEDIASKLKRNAAEISVPLQNGLLTSSGTFSDLIRPLNAQAFVVQKGGRTIQADAPVLVRRVVVECDDPESVLKGLEVEADLVAGGRKILQLQKVQATSESGSKQVLAFVNAGCTAFHVKAKASFKRLKISKFLVYGYSLPQLDGLSKALSDFLQEKQGLEAYVERKKKECKDAEEDHSAILLQISESSEELKSLAEELVAAKAATEQANSGRLDAENRLGQVKESLNRVNAELLESSNNSSQLKQTVLDLNRQIADKKGQLQALINDRSLISDEYIDYVKEGKTQARQYLLLSVLLAVVMGFCAWQLYSGADRILSTEGITPDQIFALFLQRIPFAAAIALIVGFSWKLMAALVSRIMKIHSERLSLAKLLVIAKDTVYSSTAGLAVSDDVRFKERIRLKLEMLKSHLTAELGRDFSFRAESANQQAAVERAESRGGDPNPNGETKG